MEILEGKISYTEMFRKIDLVMCNTITKIDKDFVEDNNHLFFEDDIELEIYQFYLANLSESDISRFKIYGVYAGFSEFLQLDVIPIYDCDYGCDWDDTFYYRDYEIKG